MKFQRGNSEGKFGSCEWEEQQRRNNLDVKIPIGKFEGKIWKRRIRNEAREGKTRSVNFEGKIQNEKLMLILFITTTEYQYT